MRRPCAPQRPPPQYLMGRLRRITTGAQTPKVAFPLARCQPFLRGKPPPRDGDIPDICLRDYPTTKPSKTLYSRISQTVTKAKGELKQAASAIGDRPPLSAVRRLPASSPVLFPRTRYS